MAKEWCSHCGATMYADQVPDHIAWHEAGKPRTLTFASKSAGRKATS